MRELAKKDNCVIIGRCSDYILRDENKVIKTCVVRCKFFAVN
ncbi:cytidylate kinase family protein [Eubacterium sp.]